MGLRQLTSDTLLQIWQPRNTVWLSTLKYDHRATFLIVAGVEPVTVVKHAMRMGCVLGVIVRMADWQRYVMSRVECFWVNITSPYIGSGPETCLLL